MPHVHISMYSGRSEDQKQQLIEEITNSLVKICDTKERAVTVHIKDVLPEDWYQVYGKDILPFMNELNKTPGYSMEAQAIRINDDYTFRQAEPKDVTTILTFIRELADYENLLHKVEATEERLYTSIFQERSAKVLLVLYRERPIGFALYFNNYSTFQGMKGMYLEDLYIQEGHRKKGLGKKMLAHLADIAIKDNCGRLEWVCLDWNKPALNFYKELHAEVMNEWLIHRLSKGSLNSLAKQGV